MPDVTAEPTPSLALDSATLLDVLLQSVSHDLRSPLLTLTLSADLLVQAAPDVDERASVALEGLRHGAADIERIAYWMRLPPSPARAQPAREGVISLSHVLGGRSVRTEHGDIDPLMAAVSPLLLEELLRALFGESSGELELAVGEREVLIAGPLADDCPECDGSPLAALLGSLATYSGSPIESLATLQVRLERHGGAMTLYGRRASLRLPRAPDR